MDTDTEAQLVDRLRKLEALSAGTTFAGERAAADVARDRIRARLAEFERSEPPIEVQFSLPDSWSRALFLALLRRYGIKPYRYKRQRRTTVMARMTRSFADTVLWPHFSEVDAELRRHLAAVTERVISAAIHDGHAEAEERAAPPGQLGAG